MPTKTKIEWTDYISNPLKAWYEEHTSGFGKTGHACVKISAGCQNCWASRMNARLGTGLEYTRPNLEKVLTWWSGEEETRLRNFKPKPPYKNGRSRPILFLCDMTDLFGEWVHPEDQQRAFHIIEIRPEIDFVILTKRPQNMKTFLNGALPLPNLFLGASVENRDTALQRWEPMYHLARRGWRAMVSYEPALGSVDWLHWDFLDWLICGGESGPGARPMAPLWARQARDFCAENHIPFFFKQWGEFAPIASLVERGMFTFKNRPLNLLGELVGRVGKGVAGHALDAEEWRQTP